MKKRSLSFIITLIISLTLLPMNIKANDISSVNSNLTFTAGFLSSAVIKKDGSLWTFGLDYNPPTKKLDNVKNVSIGSYQTVAVKNDNTLWAWGRNDFMNGNNNSTPMKIMDNVLTASCGSYHTMIIKTDGSLWGYGDNIYGQIGDGNFDNGYISSKIMNDVSVVSAEWYHTMAVKKDGSLWAWGTNAYGRLGTGDNSNHYTPVKIMENVVSVASGVDHTAILKSDNSLWMCGRGDLIGDGKNIDKLSPIKVMDNVISVSTGDNHTLALKSDGSLWAWGSINEDGRIGDGTTNSRLSPIKIMNNVIACSAGYNHSAALTSDGSLCMWGNNACGQLGDGTTTDRYTPKEIMNLNSTGPSIESVTHTQEVDSQHYGATKFKYTPEGKVHAAATAYNKALEEYLKAVKSETKKISNGNKTLKEKAQSLILKDESAKYKYLRFTTGTGTIPDQPKIGAYMALAEYFDYLADTAESKLNIDLDDEAYMIDAKLTKQILAKVGHYSKTSQQNGWTVSMNIVSFAKQGTGYMTIKKGSLSYYAIFSSSPEDVRDALNNFLGEIRDVTDDITKSAAKSLFAEISNITGFGDYYEALIKDSVKKSIKSLRKKGFGNILTVFKKCSDGYDLVHGIIAFSDARHIENALSNAEDIYNKLSKLDYSDNAVDNFIIKQAMDKVNNAKNTLCDELYDYMYSIGKPPKKEEFFDKATSWMKSIFQCPVDFTVYNTDGEIIGYVRDGEIYYNDDIYIETSDDVKNLYVPSDMEVRIEMTGTDEGEFNYVLEEVTDGEPIGRLNYYGIQLTEGASFEQTLNSESIAGGADNPIYSSDGDINADEYLSADDLTAFVTVETECGDEGVVIGAGDYAKGDSVELTALASDDKYTLSGWYIGDELVSTDETYRFTALENVTVRAEFARDYAADYDYATEMSDDYGDYYAYIYKDSDDGQGIIITPFVETPDDSLDIYLTAYEETTQYSAQIDKTGRYDFKNVDLHNASSVVIKDSTGTVIATMNRGNTIEQSIQTVGQYRYSADVTAYEENGAVVVDFDIIDNTLTAEDITAYLVSYTEEGALISCDILDGTATENGVKFIANPSGKCKILFWNDNQEPITEVLSVNVD